MHYYQASPESDSDQDMHINDTLEKLCYPQPPLNALLDQRKIALAKDKDATPTKNNRNSLRFDNKGGPRKGILPVRTYYPANDGRKRRSSPPPYSDTDMFRGEASKAGSHAHELALRYSINFSEDD